MVLALQVLCFKMWLGILIGLGIITKAHGYSDGNFPAVCQSMSPSHSPFSAQDRRMPFEVTYELGKSGEPITVILQSNSATQFEGFMLEARVTGMVEKSPPVGTFILLDPGATQLLTCGDQAGSAVSQRFNHQKSVIKVNWTAPAEELNITFRATFVQDYKTFWEKVDKDVILPPTTTAPLPATAASTTKPTTATSIIQPTTASTTKPTTATSATKPTTATSTTKPTTAASVIQPTTASATKPTTATSATKPTTATSTTKPTTASTTKPTTATSIIQPTTASATKPTTATSTTKPTTAASVIKQTTKLQQAGSALMAFDILLVGLKMAQAHIVTTSLTNSFRSHRLIMVSKILCSLLCAAVEISSLMLFALAQPFNVTLVTLVCVVLLVNFIEVVTDSMSVGLSHKLKEVCNVVVKVCSVIHLIFSTANVFIGVLEIVDCRETKNQRTESWLLKVMIAYTVWISLFVIWLVVFSVHSHAMMGRNKTGSSRQNERWDQQREKRTLGAAAKIATAVSVILIVGTMSFTAAVIGGIFSGK